MTAPRTPAEYYKQVGGKLNWLESLIDEATSFDERLNVSNLLLMEILKEISPRIDAVTPPLPPSIPYAVKDFDLTTERLEPGEPVNVSGNAITAITDGDLEGIVVRLDSQASDPISLAEVNPYLYPPGFTRLYLQNTAQSGKRLRLYIGTSGAIASVELTSITFAINIQAAAIMMPIDIQGAYIMMPVDIQAQYLTLDINIESVTEGVTINIGTVAGTVDINIESVTEGVTINIGTVAGTVDIQLAAEAADIKIDIDAQSVGIYLQPEWAAKVDKQVFKVAKNIAAVFSAGCEATHTVSGNAIFLLCGVSGHITVNSPITYDRFLWIFGWVLRDAGEPEARFGGLGGFSVNFSPPLRFTAGEVAKAWVENRSDVECFIGVTLWGFEIPA